MITDANVVSNTPTDLSALYHAITVHAPLPMATVEGATHVVRYGNPAFCRLMGKPIEELIGKPFDQLLPEKDNCVSLLQHVFRTRKPASYTEKDPSKPHPVFWSYTIWPVLENEGLVGIMIQVTETAEVHEMTLAMNEALILGSLRQHELTETAENLNEQLRLEIVERKRAGDAANELARRLAEADRHKDEFMAMLAHELRNPLTPIKMASQILRTAKSNNPAVNRAQEIIERQVDQMIRLVDDLLDVARLERGKVRLQKEPMNFTKAVSEAVDSCAHMITSHHHHLTLNLGRPTLFIEADPARVLQIVANIVLNAAKYTQEGGSIEVTTETVDGLAIVRVKDNGPGIVPEMLGKVFDGFTQVESSLSRSQGGLGLGLKVVKELVLLHDGSVDVRSDGVGKGCEFVVRFPKLLECIAAKDKAIEPVASGVGKKILLIEDNEDIRTMMGMTLTQNGFTFESVEDGIKGVETALRTLPDVALIDIGLPGLDGYEVANKIRAGSGGDKIVLIAVSGYGLAEDKRRAIQAGFDEHLTKPADMKDLLAIFKNLAKYNRN